jgi:hypothetical protein
MDVGDNRRARRRVGIAICRSCRSSRQTVSHYVAHVVYALPQVPLLAIAWPGWRTSSEQASGAAI